MKRNELLGNITKFILTIHDAIVVTDTMFDEWLFEHEITARDLKDNENFVCGVCSGFTWVPAVEAYLCRRIQSAPSVQVVATQEIVEKQVACPNKTTKLKNKLQVQFKHPTMSKSIR